MSSVTTVLAAHYAKHTAQNPRDTIYANMQRAVDDFPEIATAPKLLAELERSLFALESCINLRGMVELEPFADSARATIAKARGQE